jgi:hypothetical protein
MTHIRQTIRQAAAATITGLATTGANVFQSRLFPIDAENLPCWVVRTEEEEAELVDMDGGLDRELALIFQGVARAAFGETLENTLDDMAEELETVLLQNTIPGIDSLIYVGTTPEFDTDDTDSAIGYITIAYRAKYFTDQGAPSA